MNNCYFTLGIRMSRKVKYCYSPPSNDPVNSESTRHWKKSALPIDVHKEVMNCQYCQFSMYIHGKSIPKTAILESGVSVSSSNFSVISSAGCVWTDGVRLHRGRCFFSVSFICKALIWLTPASDRQTPSIKNVLGVFGNSTSTNSE
jgi:hypothetical protein